MGDICIKLSNSQKNLNLKNKNRAKHFIVVNDEDYYRLLKELKTHYAVEINSQVHINNMTGTGVDKRDIIYKLYAQLTDDERFKYSTTKEKSEEELLGIDNYLSLDNPKSNLIEYLIQNNYIHIVSEDGGVVIDETSKDSYKVCTIDDFVECLQQDFAVLFEDNFREIYDEDLLIGIRKNLSLFDSVSMELTRTNDREKFKKNCIVDSLQTKPGFRKTCERIFIENENLREQEVRYLFVKIY